MTQTSIIICGTCDGRGFTERDELVDYHRREYDTIRTKCRNCGGSGRMKKVVRTEVTAFVPEEVV
jgi:DnaJ-class molecular chaperone